MSARESFTSDDDTLLLRYIATYNPAKEGRKGNKLYKTLAENAKNRWSFAKRHPWQSWRDHYVRRQSHFDRMIDAYLKKKKEKELELHTDTKDLVKQLPPQMLCNPIPSTQKADEDGKETQNEDESEINKESEGETTGAVDFGDDKSGFDDTLQSLIDPNDYYEELFFELFDESQSIDEDDEGDEDEVAAALSSPVRSSNNKLYRSLFSNEESNNSEVSVSPSQQHDSLPSKRPVQLRPKPKSKSIEEDSGFYESGSVSPVSPRAQIPQPTSLYARKALPRAREGTFGGTRLVRGCKKERPPDGSQECEKVNSLTFSASKTVDKDGVPSIYTLKDRAKDISDGRRNSVSLSLIPSTFVTKTDQVLRRDLSSMDTIKRTRPPFSSPTTFTAPPAIIDGRSSRYPARSESPSLTASPPEKVNHSFKNSDSHLFPLSSAASPPKSMPKSKYISSAIEHTDVTQVKSEKARGKEREVDLLPLDSHAQTSSTVSPPNPFNLKRKIDLTNDDRPRKKIRVLIAPRPSSAATDSRVLVRDLDVGMPDDGDDDKNSVSIQLERLPLIVTDSVTPPSLRNSPSYQHRERLDFRPRHSLPSSTFEASEDPFVVDRVSQSVPRTFKRRHTTGDRRQPRPLDLRVMMQKSRLGRSTQFASAGFNAASPSPSVGDTSFRNSNPRWLDVALSSMAKDRGFDVAVARNLWAAVRNLEEVDECLKEMTRTCEQRAEAFLERVEWRRSVGVNVSGEKRRDSNSQTKFSPQKVEIPPEEAYVPPSHSRARKAVRRISRGKKEVLKNNNEEEKEREDTYQPRRGSSVISPPSSPYPGVSSTSIGHKEPASDIAATEDEDDTFNDNIWRIDVRKVTPSKMEALRGFVTSNDPNIVMSNIGDAFARFVQDRMVVKTKLEEDQ